MKHLCKLLLITLLASPLPAQNLWDGTPIGGASLTTSDRILVRDVAGAASGAEVRAMTLGELVNVPGLFSGFQATLVSGTTIKTINGTSMLGAGDIAIGETGIITQNINLFVQGDSLNIDPYSIGSNWPDTLMASDTWNRTGAVTLTNVAVGSKTTINVQSEQTAEANQPAKTIGISSTLVGTNDLNTGSSGALVFSRLLPIWDEAKRNGNYVVACTIPKRDDTPWTPTKETERLALNTLIRAAAAWNVPPFDALYDVSNLFDPLDYATYYHADKLHWSAAGVVALADGFEAIVPDPTFSPGSSVNQDLHQRLSRRQTTVTAYAGANSYAPFNTSGLNEHVFWNLSATRAALTLQLPSAANSRVGQVLEFSLSGNTTITSFSFDTVDSGSSAIDGNTFPRTLLPRHCLRFVKVSRYLWVCTSPQVNDNSPVDFTTSTIGKTLKVKSGANSLAGTVTLTSGAGTISSTAIDANTVIVLTLKTVSGTVGGQPYVEAITAGASATLAGGGASNNSVYNWVALKVN